MDEIDGLIGAVTDDILFKDMVLQKYGLSEDEFTSILGAIANKYKPCLPLWKLLPGLRTSYKLGIINNGTWLTFPIFDELYLVSRHFDLFVSSAREGICKPDPAIYRRACTRLGSLPQECLFMDDSPENIGGARQVGMQVIHWAGEVEGFQEFSKFLGVMEDQKAG